MQTTIRAATDRHPGRLRVVLAAAWLIASLAIGGYLGTQPGSEQPALSTVSTANQP